MAKLGEISIDEAKKISPGFVARDYSTRDFTPYFLIEDGKLKRGTKVLVRFLGDKYSIAKVTSIKPNLAGEYDVRVANGEYSWRVDTLAVI